MQKRSFFVRRRNSWLEQSEIADRKSQYNKRQPSLRTEGKLSVI
ncbi:hypothetical protein [Paenibacillus sp. DCT19]|nr:hypothetical protein [Paenibacillus sp. DCT19]